MLLIIPKNKYTDKNYTRFKQTMMHQKWHIIVDNDTINTIVAEGLIHQTHFCLNLLILSKVLIEYGLKRSSSEFYPES